MKPDHERLTSAESTRLLSMTYERAAADLAERIEALATALHVTGVPPERSGELLAAAAGAAARALMLHSLLDEPAGPESGRAAPNLRIAA